MKLGYPRKCSPLNIRICDHWQIQDFCMRTAGSPPQYPPLHQSPEDRTKPGIKRWGVGYPGVDLSGRGPSLRADDTDDIALPWSQSLQL